MHCEDPGCLKACPSPGAIVQYANGIVDFHEENCIGCGYCVTGCPFDIPRISKKDHKAYKCTLCSDRVAVGLEPACVKTCPDRRHRVRHQGGHAAACRRAHRGPEERAASSNAGLYDPAGVERHARDVRAAPRRPAGAVQRSAHRIRTSVRPCACGRVWPSRWRVALMALTALAGFFHYIRVGPDETDASDEAAAEAARRNPEKTA